MIDYSQQLRKEKIEPLSYEQAEKQLFEWVKTNVISLREFKQLNKEMSLKDSNPRLIDLDQ